MGRKPPNSDDPGDQRGVSATEGDVNREHENGNYSVGYGRPPVHTRFKPGQSGNPKGRAKNTLNVRTVVNQVLSEGMKIRETNGERRVSAMEALVRTLRARAFKGDPKATASLLQLARLCGMTDKEEPATEVFRHEDFETIIEDFVARYVDEKAATESRDGDPTSPDPDLEEDDDSP